jgi:hypothetical protein
MNLLNRFGLASGRNSLPFVWQLNDLAMSRGSLGADGSIARFPAAHRVTGSGNYPFSAQRDERGQSR